MMVMVLARMPRTQKQVRKTPWRDKMLLCGQSGPAWPHLDIKAAFLHIRGLVEVFKAVVVNCQLFPLLATSMVGVRVLWNFSDYFTF